MRPSLVLIVATLACSADTIVTSEPLLPAVPTNPLISLLASEPATYVMSRLGDYDSPPYVINESICNELPYRTEVADSIFFHGDGTYRRVYRAYSLLWRTVGVAEPVQMNGRYKVEQKGTVGGEGDVLTLSATHWQQNDMPFEPYNPVLGRRETAFAINGAQFTKPETLGRGCQGERISVEAVFTRTSE